MRNIVLICSAFVVLILLAELRVLDFFTLFFLAGIVPGTDIVMSPYSMLIGFLVVLIALIAKLSPLAVSEYLTRLGAYKKRSALKKRLPKRRYSSV